MRGRECAVGLTAETQRIRRVIGKDFGETCCAWYAQQVSPKSFPSASSAASLRLRVLPLCGYSNPPATATIEPGTALGRIDAAVRAGLLDGATRMTSLPFAHLHCHSHYSLLDGAASISKLIQRAKERGMNALAITDHGNLHGALEFYRKAKAAEINPILGYEAYIAPGSRFQKDAGRARDSSYHLTLLARNRTGFRNLVKLASAAYLEGFYFKPRIDKQLLQQHHEGIICLSGCVSGELSRSLLRGGMVSDEDLAEPLEVARWFQSLFGPRYFIEIQNNGAEVQRLAMEGSIHVAQRLGIPLVATSDAHYADREDAEAQDVMLCINTGKFRTDSSRLRMDGNEYYLRSPEEMYRAFPQHADAVARSQEIADSVDIDLNLGQRHFPTYSPLPVGKTAEQFLREICLQGLRERYAGDDEMMPAGELSQGVMERLDRELAVINTLGFPNYFLIVWDFVRQAREMQNPDHRPWQWCGGAGLLRALPEPCLSDQV